jgi:uncharacterized protein YceH (UPF0502 family)
MPVELTPNEARVIGSLIEKEITTPEHYPLSINSLTNACNQKSNRDPVLELDEATVQQTLDALNRRFLVSDQTGYGSRVTKYQHRFCNGNFGGLKFSPRELAVLCELLLRGPQTPGELRSRASRMCAFSDVSEVDHVLTQLAQREDGPFVVRLAREPGRRESRYAHLFSGEVEGAESSEHMVTAVLPAPTLAATGSAIAGEARNAAEMEDLQDRVTRLEAEIAELRALLEDLTAP